MRAFILALVIVGAPAAAEGTRVVPIGEPLADISDRTTRLEHTARTTIALDRRVNLVARLRLPAGGRLARDVDGTFCSPAMYFDSYGMAYEGCLQDTDNDGKFDRVSSYKMGASEKLKTPIPFTVADEHVEVAPKIIRSLVYLGGSASEIRLSYREYTRDGLARPAFTEQLSVPVVSYPASLNIKGYRFIALGQTSDGLRIESLNP